MKKCLLMLIIMTFALLAGCRGDDTVIAPDTGAEPSGADVSLYKPVPEEPVLSSAKNLDYDHNEENNIWIKYIIQSNRFSYPVSYGLASNNISLREIVLGPEGVLLDYTPGFDEIFVVTKGELKLVVDNSKDYILSKDDTIALKSSLKRRMLNSSEGESICFIISCPPFNPEKLKELPLTLDDENSESLISKVIRIENINFSEDNQVQLQKIIYPEIFPAGVVLGMITLPPGTVLKDISLGSESIYCCYDNELIMKDKKSNTNFIISGDKYLYVPAGSIINIYNVSNEIRNLIYFYPGS